MSARAANREAALQSVEPLPLEEEKPLPEGSTEDSQTPKDESTPSATETEAKLPEGLKETDHTKGKKGAKSQ